MQHDFSSPEAYLASLPEDWRGALAHRLDALLRAHGLVPEIGYKMLAYADEAGPVLHLNAQSRHVGLYPGRLDRVAPEILEGFDCGAGCIRLKRRDSQAIPRVEAVILRVLEVRGAGIDPGC